MKPALPLFLALIAATWPACADVRLPSLFASHMVLQRDAPVPIWGWADPGELVRVRFAGQEHETLANAKGTWRIVLAPLAAESAGRALIVEGRNHIELSNVLVGELWLCSGQSNMTWPVARSADAEAEIRAAQDPRLRLWTAERRVAEEPQADVPSTWQVCTPESVARFSAVAYSFGRELRRRLDLPVGLLHSSWGGTLAEAWTSRPALEALPAAQPILERYAEACANLDERLAAYRQARARWEAEGKQGRRPPYPLGPGHYHSPSGLFNAMIAPLRPARIRGVIWYQGESNARRAAQYRELFPALIRDWRRAFSQPELPFLFVQLAGFGATPAEPSDPPWAHLRDAQLHTLRVVPDTGLACAIDIGDPRDIHPRNKQAVGRRLARWALAETYGRDVVASGPVFQEASFEGAQVRVHFQLYGSHLALPRRGPIRGFSLAGADRRFVWAEARLAGDAVIVEAPGVTEPHAVRYAWANCPRANLCNQEGLPAVPFRSDDWPRR